VAYLPALLSLHHLLDAMDSRLLVFLCDRVNGRHAGVGEDPAEPTSEPRKGIAYSSLGLRFVFGCEGGKTDIGVDG